MIWIVCKAKGDAAVVDVRTTTFHNAWDSVVYHVFVNSGIQTLSGAEQRRLRP